MARAENDTEGLTEPQRLWVEALRSGNYKQAKYVLCELDPKGEPVGWCCLGVACDVARNAGVEVAATSGTHKVEGSAATAVNARYFDTEPTVLPPAVREWLGLRASSGAFVGDENQPEALASLNDEGASFDCIADIIESRPEGLFR